MTSLLISRKLYLQETEVISKLQNVCKRNKTFLFCVHICLTYANSTAPTCCVIGHRIFAFLRMQRANPNTCPKTHARRKQHEARKIKLIFGFTTRLHRIKTKQNSFEEHQKPSDLLGTFVLKHQSGHLAPSGNRQNQAPRALELKTQNRAPCALALACNIGRPAHTC